MAFTRNSSILCWAVHEPITLSQLQVSWGTWNQSLKNHGFICVTIFSTCTHVHKAHRVKRYVGWGSIVNCFTLPSLLCFPVYRCSAIPTSYYIFNSFFFFWCLLWCHKCQNLTSFLYFTYWQHKLGVIEAWKWDCFATKQESRNVTAEGSSTRMQTFYIKFLLRTQVFGTLTKQKSWQQNLSA